MVLNYNEKHKEGVIKLLQLNTPQFFDIAEEKDFERYLENEADNYYVIAEPELIIAAGGYNLGFEEGKAARISWDMVHPAYQGKGLGTKLLHFRIEEIKANTFVQKIIVRTTQLTFEFYQKNGFRLISTKKDFWAKGFHLYQMELRISD